MDILTQFVNADKVGGWMRAWVGTFLGVEIATHPALASYLPADAQTALGIVAGSLVAGIWSHIAKTMRASQNPTSVSIQG